MPTIGFLEAAHFSIKQYYLLVRVFCTSFRGARRPLAREPDEEHLNDDITETNLSIDFSAMSE